MKVIGVRKIYESFYINKLYSKLRLVEMYEEWELINEAVESQKQH